MSSYGEAKSLRQNEAVYGHEDKVLLLCDMDASRWGIR